MKNSPDKNSFDDARRAREGSDEDALEIAALSDSFAFDAGAESELKPLLESWRVPAAPSSLRARVAASYRQQFSRREEKVMNSMTSAGVGHGYAFAHAEYHLTILEDERLLSRLAARVREVARESELTWPELRRDPLNFARRLVAGYALLAARALGRENVGYGLGAAFGVLLAVALGVAAAGGFAARRDGMLAVAARDDLTFEGWVEDVPKAQPTPEQGAAGFAKGTGGGMKQKFERPGGGGGGGREEDKPAVGGKLPPASLAPQVLAPDPHPPAIKNPQLPTQATIRADPTLFPPDPRPLNYGDPKSSATELSSGSGKGNGIGEGEGGGVGTGKGAGYGPGEGFNTGGGPGHIGGGGPGGGGGGGGTIDYHKIFRPQEVSRRAQVISRPEPLYTEEARRNQIVGTVTLRLVLNANGTVTNITSLSRLPDGLTERAIEAARQIRFTPAEKDGRRVSQYATIQYNFNIY